MNLLQRVTHPTPPFFRKLRNIGIALATISAAIISAPVSMPLLIITSAQYLAIAGTVLGAISQLTISDIPEREASLGA